MPLLENSVSIGVLLFLLDHDGSTRQQVRDSVSHTSTIVYRISELEEAGLIESEPVHRSRATALYLTDEGREVASRLKEISSIVSSAEQRMRIS